MKKNIIKPILKYTGIFIITVLVAFALLILTSAIPKSAIEKNIKDSVNFFKNNAGIQELVKKRDFTYIHYYADAIIMNIIYHSDSTDPVKSAMWANHYRKIQADVNDDFIESVTKELKPNTEYLRYWHGSIVALRPLLTILNIEQIYLLNEFLLYLLALTLFIVIIKRSKKIATIYLIAMIMTVFPIVPFCIEFSSTYYIMFITSLIAIKIEKKGDKGLFKLFFITGMVTCFFDFLTTEILTIGVPILLVLAIRKEDNRLQSFKDGIIFILKSGILWLTSYSLMWLAKWVLASLILNINAFEYVKDKALLRMNGGNTSTNVKYFDALYRNWHNLYPINIIKTKSTVIILSVLLLVISIIMLDWKKIKKKYFSLFMLIIAIIPYVRYLVLANHSYYHAFFTFRSQMISIIAFLLIIVDCYNRKLIQKILRLKNRKLSK